MHMNKATIAINLLILIISRSTHEFLGWCGLKYRSRNKMKLTWVIG